MAKCSQVCYLHENLLHSVSTCKNKKLRKLRDSTDFQFLTAFFPSCNIFFFLKKIRLLEKLNFAFQF